MKTHPKLAACALLLAILNPQPSTGFAQGSLTPPGAPAAMMKTLDQIEARTPISSVPFSITNPGAYYLTTNLTVTGGDAITIATNGVTLDLNGFTISSTAVSAGGSGILLPIALRDIYISNGHIRGSATNNGSGVYGGGGFASGIYDTTASSDNVIVSHVSVYGCISNGIFLNTGRSVVVEACTVKTAGNYGIAACIVKGSTVYDCGNIAIFGFQVSDSHGDSWGGGYGVFANSAVDCQGYCNGNGSGLRVNAAALNCEGGSSQGTGITGNLAQNCYGYSFNATGMVAAVAQNCSGSGLTVGLQAGNAVNCSGSAPSGTGILGDTNASLTDCDTHNCSIGISVGPESKVRNCVAVRSINHGILAGDGCTISDCLSENNGGSGVYAKDGCTVTGCTVRTNGADGIVVGYGCTVRNCTASDNRNDGIQAFSASHISGNECYNNGAGAYDGAGVHVTGNNNRVDENHVSTSDRGIHITGIDNFVIRNSVSYTSTNYVIAAGNRVGVIVTAPASGAISGATGGSGVGSTDPWANFSAP